MPEHNHTEQVPYTPEQMFNLVADVEAYPDFLPWCQSVRIREPKENSLLADMVIGFKGRTERYTSQVLLDRKAMSIQTLCDNGPFRHLENRWRFSPDGGGCVVDFFVSFEFRSWLLRQLANAAFSRASEKMLAAFHQRAIDLYGPSR